MKTTVSHCHYCNEPKGEVLAERHKYNIVELPQKGVGVIDDTPCETCQDWMRRGIISHSRKKALLYRPHGGK